MPIGIIEDSAFLFEEVGTPDDENILFFLTVVVRKKLD